MLTAKLFVFAALAVLLAVCRVSAQAGGALLEDSDDAKLLVVKNILNNYIIEASDIEIRYDIYNVGNVPALNVKLLDDNFPKDKFEYVSGFSSVRWAKISPASNVSHVAIVRPKIVGAYNFTSATVSYLANEKAGKPQIGYSTELGQVYIQLLKEYNRRFATHTIDWILFVVMASPSILFPFFLWFNSKNKYEAIAKSKREKTN